MDLDLTDTILFNLAQPSRYLGPGGIQFFYSISLDLVAKLGLAGEGRPHADVVSLGLLLLARDVAVAGSRRRTSQPVGWRQSDPRSFCFLVPPTTTISSHFNKKGMQPRTTLRIG